MELGLDTIDEVAASKSGLKKVVMVLIGVAGIMAALAAVQLMIVSHRSARAEVNVSRVISQQGLRYNASFALDSLNTQIRIDQLALGEDMAVRIHGDMSDRWIAGAENLVFQKLSSIIEEVDNLPSNPALEPFPVLQRALASDVDDTYRLTASVSRAMATADSYSSSERMAALSLFVLAIGVALLAFSGIVGGRGASRLTLGVASLALMACGFLMTINFFTIV
jgi:hypothetical protein